MREEKDPSTQGAIAKLGPSSSVVGSAGPGRAARGPLTKEQSRKQTPQDSQESHRKGGTTSTIGGEKPR